LTLRLALTSVAGALTAERLDLTAKAIEAVQSGLRAFGTLSLTAGDERLLRLMKLLAEPLQAGGDLCLGAVGSGVDSRAEPVGGTLDTSFEVGLVHSLERRAKFVGGCALGRIELACGVAHVLLDVRHVVGHALAILGKLLHFLSGRLSGLSRTGRPLFQPPDAIGLLFFLTGQAIGLSRHRPETVGGFLRLDPAEQVACFAKALGGQTRVGRTPRIGRRAAHLVLCLTQTVECLLSRLLRAPRALVAGRLRSARLT